MAFLKELWTSLIYQALYEDPDLNMLFNRSLETLARSGGSKIIIPTLGTGVSVVRTDNLSVGNGLPLTVKDVDKDSLSFDVLEYSTDPIVIRNLDVVQSNENLLNASVQEIKQIFKEFILQTISTHIINGVASANKVEWNGTTFSGSDLADMETILDDGNILESDRFAILKSADRKTVLSDTNLASYMATQQTNILKGQLPELFGFGIKKSALTPLTTALGAIDATPANNIKRNVLGFRKQHMHLVIQTDFEITGSEDAKYLGGVYAFTTRFGVKLEKDTAAVQKIQP